jgi:hypothetical protein
MAHIPGTGTAVTGVIVQILLDPVGVGIVFTTQRDAQLPAVALFHFFADLFPHGFPAVKKPGLPILTELILAILRVTNPGTM